jgi:hypothetical protein
MEQAGRVSAEPNGLVADFAYAESLERELRAVAAAEAECCPFLDIAVERSDERLRLSVSGPAEAKPLIAQMFQGAPGSA